MLSLTARLADGWIPSQAYAQPDETAVLNKRLDVLATDAGRQPADIVRVYNVNGRFAPGGRGFLDGPAGQWAEQLTELVLKQGFSSFILGSSGDIIASISPFADEVVPDVRERVAAERLGRPREFTVDRPSVELTVEAEAGAQPCRGWSATAIGGCRRAAGRGPAARRADRNAVGSNRIERARPGQPPEPGRHS